MGMHQGFDLSRFKKVASDKDTTTLKHANGHEIRLAHGGLTPKMRADLDKLPIHMADGGDTQDLGKWATQVTDQPLDAGVGSDDIDPESPAPADNTQNGDRGPFFAGTVTPSSVTDNNQPTADEGPDQSGNKTIPPPTAQQLNADDAMWEHDLQNGHITPETYQHLFEKKDTLGKIGTLFGLLVGGGSNTNMTMHMMDREIQNDYNAQVQNKHNAVNYYNSFSNMMRTAADVDYINSNTYKNKLQLVAAQHLTDKVDQLPPGPYQSTMMNTLNQMRQMIRVQNMQRNAATEQGLSQRAFSRLQQGGGPQSPSGAPVNWDTIGDLGVAGQLVGVNGGGLAQEGQFIEQGRRGWSTYLQQVKDLESLPQAGMTGEAAQKVSDLLGGVAHHVPLAGEALRNATGVIGDTARKIQQRRDAILAANPGIDESLLPNVYDMLDPGVRSKKVQEAATFFDNRENGLPNTSVAEHKGYSVRTPPPYLNDAQSYASSHSRSSSVNRTASKTKKKVQVSPEVERESDRAAASLGD